MLFMSQVSEDRFIAAVESLAQGIHLLARSQPDPEGLHASIDYLAEKVHDGLSDVSTSLDVVARSIEEWESSDEVSTGLVEIAKAIKEQTFTP